jgi:hypothetical protein
MDAKHRKTNVSQIRLNYRQTLCYGFDGIRFGIGIGLCGGLLAHLMRLLLCLPLPLMMMKEEEE